jgi:DNA-binding MarR family transcriptional regulator
MSKRKEAFAPIPARALNDPRLTLRHWRLLAAIAIHDRFGRNGHGCWAGSKRLAQEAGLSESHLSDAISDLNQFGYVASERHPMNRSTKIHRVIYTEADNAKIASTHNTSRAGDVSSRNVPRPFRARRGNIMDAIDRLIEQTGAFEENNTSRQGEVSSQDTSHLSLEYFPRENAKGLKGNEKETSNILGINLIRDCRESFEIEVGKDCAQARLPKKERWTPDSAEAYLSDVQSALLDESTRAAVRCEYPVLSEIADDETLPIATRDRAAGLRDVARDAA